MRGSVSDGRVRSLVVSVRMQRPVRCPSDRSIQRSRAPSLNEPGRRPARAAQTSPHSATRRSPLPTMPRGPRRRRSAPADRADRDRAQVRRGCQRRRLRHGRHSAAILAKCPDPRSLPSPVPGQSPGLREVPVSVPGAKGTAPNHRSAHPPSPDPPGLRKTELPWETTAEMQRPPTASSALQQRKAESLPARLRHPFFPANLQNRGKECAWGGIPRKCRASLWRRRCTGA